MNEFKVIFYEKTKNDIPVEKFIDSLDYKTIYKLLSMIQVLEENGNRIRPPLSKHIGDGIYELRCKYFINAIRILYFFNENKEIVLTNAFIKKTNKTPQNEIKLAKQRRKDYIERKR